MKRFTTTAFRTILMLALLSGVAAPARADWLLTPYLGVTFAAAGDIRGIRFDDFIENRPTYGVGSTWMSEGIVGFEIDFAHTPDFFDFPGVGNVTPLQSSVSTLMGNLVLGVPIGGTQGPGVRPYGSGGMGLLRTNVTFLGFLDDLGANDLGLNVGGGVYVFFTDSIGLRGDLRYFRGLQGEDAPDEDPLDLDLSAFDFWRASIGLTFRFGG